MNALEGIRVVEIGEGVSAAFCARLLADYGADVVKVEAPGRGDVTRGWGPFPGDVPHPERSGLFFSLNLGKRGVTLDLGGREGRDRLFSLLGGADLLVENLTPQARREAGLGGRALAAAFPDLAVVSITPFGLSGPCAQWKGYDLNAFHFSATGSRYCGRPLEAPLEQGTFAADYFGGYVAAAWGLGALLAPPGRRGEHVDVSCAEALAALFVGAQNIGGYAQDGVFETRCGAGMRLAAPATILPCRDGHVWMMALEPGQWQGLGRAMDNPEWMGLDLFQDMFTRAENSDLIYPLLEEWTRQHTKLEIMDRCQKNGCPTTAVFTVEDAATHPHLAQRGFFSEIEHAELGRVRSLGPPVRLAEGAAAQRRPAPRLGEHDRELQEGLLFPGGAARPRGPAAPAAAGADRAGESSEAPRAGTAPLAGVRVLNFGWGWLGPVAGQTLARLGAEVYKVESRVRVDINRTIPPFAAGVRDPDRSLQNHAGWAGNGSVTIDLKQAEGVEVALELAAHCDVALENFGPGVMEKLGLGWEALRRVNPRLVMVAMPAAGLFGSLSRVRTYGTSLASLTGLDSVTGYAGGPLMPMENAYADPLGGVIGAFAALLGLHHRQRSGKGQLVDFSQQEGVMQLVAPAFMDFFLNGRVAGPIGNRHPSAAAAPHGVFPCRGEDRWISLAVLTDAEWRGLRAAMGEPAWAQAAELDGAPGRVAATESLHAQIAAWTREQDDHDLAQRLQGFGVAAAPVLNVADLLHDPHYAARGTFVEIQHPLGFPETVYADYVKSSRASVPYQPGPAMGQDNEHVFRGLLGMSGERYQDLTNRRILY